MCKFSKFSKFISACFSFGILFSGLQTYGMNLDMLGIGGNRNQDDDIISIKTNETTSSVLDGIKVEFPNKCVVCSQKAFRVLSVPVGLPVSICRDNDCLKKIFDKFNIKLNTENIHRCDWFKNNIKNYQIAKKRLSYNYIYIFKKWEIFDEDKLINERFLPCGHSICRCQNCIRQVEVCPACKASAHGGILVSEIDNMNRPTCQTMFKIIKLLSKKLKNEWKNIIVLSDNPYNNVDEIAADMYCFFISQNNFDSAIFDENKFSKVDDIALGGKILVLDMNAKFSDSLKFLSWTKFDSYIKSLKECGKDKMIVYPTTGELYRKIAAIRIGGDKKLQEVFNMMQEDDVE